MLRIILLTLFFANISFAFDFTGQWSGAAKSWDRLGSSIDCDVIRINVQQSTEQIVLDLVENTCADFYWKPEQFVLKVKENGLWRDDTYVGRVQGDRIFFTWLDSSKTLWHRFEITEQLYTIYYQHSYLDRNGEAFMGVRSTMSKQ